MTAEQRDAVGKIAIAHGWENMTTKDVGLLLWALFRYYAMRLGWEER